MADLLGQLPILIVNSRGMLMHSVSDKYTDRLDNVFIKFKPRNNSKNKSLI